MAEWTKEQIYYDDGAMIPVTNYLQGCIAVNLENVIKVVKAITSATLADTISRFFKDPSNSISSIRMYPFTFPLTPVFYKVQVLGEDLTYNTDPIGCRLVEPEFYHKQHILFEAPITGMRGAPHYYDYNGYTKIFLQLPYYGEVEVMANDVMGKILSVSYAINIITGEIIYFISVCEDVIEPLYERRVLAKYVTNIGVDIPIGSFNAHSANSNFLLGSLNTVVSIAGTVASMGLTARSIPYSLTTFNHSGSVSVSERADRPRARMRETYRQVETDSDVFSRNIPIPRQALNGVEKFAQNTINTLNNSIVKGHGDHTRNGMLTQFLSHKVICSIYRPKLVFDDHNMQCGMPCGKYGTLSDFTGYTKMASVFIQNFSDEEAIPTLQEIEMLKELLYSGIILSNNIL